MHRFRILLALPGVALLALAAGVGGPARLVALAAGSALLGAALAVDLARRAITVPPQDGTWLTPLRVALGAAGDDPLIDFGSQWLPRKHYATLLQAYRDPEAVLGDMPAEERDALCRSLRARRDELAAVYELMTEQLRNLNGMVGWSHDPELTVLALHARLGAAHLVAPPAVADARSDLRRAVAKLDADRAFAHIAAALPADARVPQPL